MSVFNYISFFFAFRLSVILCTLNVFFGKATNNSPYRAKPVQLRSFRSALRRFCVFINMSMLPSANFHSLSSLRYGVRESSNPKL